MEQERDTAELVALCSVMSLIDRHMAERAAREQGAPGGSGVIFTLDKLTGELTMLDRSRMRDCSSAARRSAKGRGDQTKRRRLNGRARGRESPSRLRRRRRSITVRALQRPEPSPHRVR